MLTHDYQYDTVLDGSLRNAWTVDDCFQDRTFDFTKSFVPERIAGVRGISCLDGDEKRMLNQIRGNTYCHIFAFVEEYIVPMVMDSARADVYGDETPTAVAAALRRGGDQAPGADGPRLPRVRHWLRRRVRPRSQDARRWLRSCWTASQLAALLLTSMIEWFTQLHYTEHVRDRSDLDDLFRDLLRFHWIDESRHARLDSLLIDEVAATLSADERERAIDELLQLGGAIDGLLAQQVELDIDALQRATGRQFSDAERDEIRIEQLRAYRWTFIVSGLEHPNFVRIVNELTEHGTAKIAAAAQALAA